MQADGARPLKMRPSVLVSALHRHANPTELQATFNRAGSRLETLMLRLRRDALCAAGAMIVLIGGVHSLGAQSGVSADVSAPLASGQSADAPLAAAQPAGIAPADLGFRFHGYLRSGFGPAFENIQLQANI